MDACWLCIYIHKYTYIWHGRGVDVGWEDTGEERKEKREGGREKEREKEREIGCKDTGQATEKHQREA